MSKVSVIIPCYNLGQYLNEAVDSILNQTYQDYEIIIVNDGSTDEFTNNLLKEYNRPKTTVFTTVNQGLPITRNYGIERAKGDYICCIDADDKYHPEFLEKTVSVFEQDNNCQYGIVTTNYEVFENSSAKIEIIDFNPYVLAVENRLHVASLFRKKCWDEVGGYDSNLSGYQDWNFWVSIIAKGYQWFTVKEFLFYYRDRDGSMLKGSDLKRKELMSTIFNNNKEFYMSNIENIFQEFIKQASSDRAYIKNLVESEKLYLSQINGYEKQLNETQHQLNETQHQLNKTQNQLNKTQNQLNEIINSQKWGIAVKLSKYFNVVFPRSTFRRRLVRFFYKITRWFYCNFKKLNNINFYTVKINNKKWIMGRPLVSVIIPCFNYGEYIEGALDSVLNQTFLNYEIIVVDGGSTDGITPQILKNIDKPKVSIYFRDARCLVGDNRNFGIKLAKGKYICCLDADDLIEPTYLEKGLFYLESYKYDVVHPSVQCFEGKNIIWHAKTATFEKMMNVGNFVSTASIFTKKAWEKSGGYKDWPIGVGHVPEDWEFWTRLLGYGFRFKPLKEPLMLYRVHGSGLTASCESSVEEQRLIIYNENINLLSQKMIKRREKENRTNYLVNNKFINLRVKKTKKRILLALPFMIIGGADTVLLKIFKSLCKEYDITIITTLKAPATYGDNTSEYKKITGEIYHLPVFLENEFEKKDFVHYIIESRQIDFIFIVGCEFIYHMLPEIKTKSPNIKVFDQLYNEYGHIENNRKYKKYIDMNIVENEKIMEVLVKKYKESKSKIEIIKNGVDTHFYNKSEINRNCIYEKYSLPNNNYIISFLGRFSAEKAPDAFLEIAKKILHLEKITFFMGGNGSLYEKINSKVKKENLENKILMPGFVNTKEILEVTDLLILPSIIDGRPNIVLESLSMSVPVIASKVGGLPEIIENGYNGYLCEPSNIEDFSSKINYVLENNILLKQMKDNSREYAHKYLGQNIMLTKYNEIFEKFSRKL